VAKALMGEKIKKVLTSAEINRKPEAI